MTTRTGQKLEVPMVAKHVRFKARISEMGDKYVIVVPKAYHEDIDKRKWLQRFLYVDIVDEEE